LLHFIYSKTNNILFFEETKNLIKQLKGVKFWLKEFCCFNWRLHSWKSC